MARGILITELLRAQDFRIEVRTSDPASPADGRCWVRSDLDAEADKAGEFRFSLGGQIYSVWVMEPTTTPAGVEEYLRIETGSGIKVLPLSPRTDAIQPEISVETPAGVYGAWSPPEVSVDTIQAENITTDAADLRGDLVTKINSNEVEVNFNWRETGNSTWNTTSILNLQSAQEFVQTIDNLQSGVEYEFQATGNDAEYTNYEDLGAILSFTTTEPTPDPGMKMYLIGTNEMLFEYDLGGAFNPSSGMTLVNSYDLTAHSTLGQGASWSITGDKFYYVDNFDKTIIELSSGSPFSTTSLSFSNSDSVSATPRGLLFNGDGTELYISDQDHNSIREYTLSSAFDLSSASFNQSADFSSNIGTIRDINWRANGGQLFILDTANDATINEYYQSSGSFDIESQTYVTETTITDPFGDTVSNLSGMAWNDDGSKFFLTTPDDAYIYEVVLSTNWDINSIDQVYSQYRDGDANGFTSVAFNGAPQYNGFNQ